MGARCSENPAQKPSQGLQTLSVWPLSTLPALALTQSPHRLDSEHTDPVLPILEALHMLFLGWEHLFLSSNLPFIWFMHSLPLALNWKNAHQGCVLDTR